MPTRVGTVGSPSKTAQRVQSQESTSMQIWRRALFGRKEQLWQHRVSQKEAGRRGSRVRHLPIKAQAANLASVASVASAAHLEGKLRIIGIGQRGSSAVGRLLQNTQMAGAEVWCLDSDAKTLEASGVQNRIFLQDGKDPPTRKDLERIVGMGAADKDGKGNINVGDGGVAFVLTSAGSVPGGSETLLRLVQSLRAAGHFTAVALTQPFEFEGARKSQAADEMVSTVQEIAHLVAIIEQDVLSKVMTNASGSPMTVAEATLIADNALEHIVRCVLAALQAPEILKSTQGALIWHGREMRRFRRLLSPPLQRLLSRPGSAALGRGVAAMPSGYGQSLGDAQSLMQLASDAVRAAAESPFLEASVGRASGVLCCVTLPQPTLRTPEEDGEAATSRHAWEYESSKVTARLAVQAAAGALMSVCPCDEIILCCMPPEPHQARQRNEDGTLKVEVSLLVLRDPKCGSAQLPPTIITDPPPLRESSRAQPSVARQKAAPQAPATTAHEQERSNAQRLPASTWGAMSAMAGGAINMQPQLLRTATPPHSPPHSNVVQVRLPSHAPVSAHQQPPASQRGRPSSPGQAPGTDPLDRSATIREVLTVSGKADASRDKGTIGDQLLDNLIAQSLDLPPKAAKWRQSQRAKSERPRLMVQAPEAAWQAQEEPEPGLKGTLRTLLGEPTKDFDVRERTFAILERDRGDVWGPDQQDG